jgi:hypothetical protein
MTKQPSEVYQLPDGTWTHCLTCHGGFADAVTAATDLRFCRDLAAADAYWQIATLNDGDNT